MIKSFGDKRTAALFEGLTPKGVDSDVVKRAHAKLALLNAAATLDFLRSPPGNRLGVLKGDRAGRHSIQVNGQWRIYFERTVSGAENVESCYYH